MARKPAATLKLFGCPMTGFTPQIAALAASLNAELAPQTPMETILVDQILWAAVRMHMLMIDPRSIVPLGEKEWNRAYHQASQVFHRAHNALNRLRRASSSTRTSLKTAPAPESRS